MIVLVSACMLGVNCRYDGGNVRDEKLITIIEKENVVPIPVCPEQLGGLPTPRKKCEIVGGDGFDVLEGNARVVSEDGVDLTEHFLKGAEEVLKIAKIVKADLAVMRDGSPSCGCGRIYDGSFSGKKVEGYGVTSALLIRNGFRVVSVEDLNFQL